MIKLSGPGLYGAMERQLGSIAFLKTGSWKYKITAR